MRLFIALPVPEDVRWAVGGLIARLRQSGADFKWVEAENLHLTLAFLGEVSSGRMSDLGEALREGARGGGPFELSFGGLDAFDSLDHPRVLWLGAGEGARSLEGLAGSLKDALERRGLLPEKDKGRPFHAHLTLGRMRGRRNLEKLQVLLRKMPSIEGLRFRAERLVLFESRLSAKGPDYTALREEPLTG